MQYNGGGEFPLIFPIFFKKEGIEKIISIFAPEI